MCNVELPMPDIDTQNEIVRAYQVITDRIALKRRINGKLEEMAEILYAKLLSQSSDMSETVPLSYFGNVITGKTPPTNQSSYYGNDIAFIKTPDMHSGIFVTSSENFLSHEGANFQGSKYLPPKTVIVACIGANAGEVAITGIPAQTNKQINGIITIYPCYIYFFIKNNTDLLRSLGEGSLTMLNINKTSFENFKVLLPPREQLDYFESVTDGLFETVLNNQLEIDISGKALPLLMSRLAKEII
jgi:type I restriction enzyme S subunit